MAGSSSLPPRIEPYRPETRLPIAFPDKIRPERFLRALPVWRDLAPSLRLGDSTDRWLPSDSERASDAAPSVRERDGLIRDATE